MILVKYFELLNTLKLFKKKVFSSKYYWYEVKFIYKSAKNFEKKFSFHHRLGFKDQKLILNSRDIKTTIKALHLNKGIPKRLLVNGVLEVEVFSYLGRFKR